MYSDFLTLIEQIPSSFWGVVIGSFFSIAGVALTNRASDRRLLEQFEYEQKQKITDREMALRKEIYLATAEAIAAGTHAVSQLANLNLTNDELTADYFAKAPVIAKAHIIANTKTIQTLTNLTGELSAIFLKLFATRFELMLEKKQIDILDHQIAEYLNAQKRYLEMITQYNLDGVDDSCRWQTLQENFTFEQTRTNDTFARRDKLANSLYWKQLEFMLECVSDTRRLGRLAVPVLSAVREELELPFDEKSYIQALENGLSKQECATDDFVRKFETFIGEPIVQPTSP